MPLVNQDTHRPTNKVTAATLGGAVSVLIVFILNLFQVQVPAEAAASLTTVMAFLFGYFVRDRENI